MTRTEATDAERTWTVNAVTRMTEHQLDELESLMQLGLTPYAAANLAVQKATGRTVI